MRVPSTCIRLERPEFFQQRIDLSAKVREVRLPKGAHARTDEGWDWLRADEIAQLLADRELSPAHRSMLVVAI
jgi:hypothetical protein